MQAVNFQIARHSVSSSTHQTEVPMSTHIQNISSIITNYQAVKSYCVEHHIDMFSEKLPAELSHDIANSALRDDIGSAIHLLVNSSKAYSGNHQHVEAAQVHYKATKLTEEQSLHNTPKLCQVLPSLWQQTSKLAQTAIKQGNLTSAQLASMTFIYLEAQKILSNPQSNHSASDSQKTHDKAVNDRQKAHTQHCDNIRAILSDINKAQEKLEDLKKSHNGTTLDKLENQESIIRTKHSELALAWSRFP